MRKPDSTLLLLSDDPEWQARIATQLLPSGWRCERSSSAALARRLADPPYPAAVLVDRRNHDVAEVTAAIRQAASPFSGTPVLEGPLDPQALLDGLRHWTGPIEAHGLRADPHDPRYRLVRLLGFDQAEAMIARFRSALVEALAHMEGGAPPSAEAAHKLAGLAGLVGYGAIGALWSRVERGEAGALAEAVSASRAAVRDI